MGANLMANDYIPRRNALALAWMSAFGAGISSAPGTYHLLPADAAAIEAAVAAFAAAQSAAENPATRTRVTVNQRDAARAAAEQLCRRYAAAIKSDAGVSDADKIAIGVRPIKSARARVPSPATSPLLNLIGSTPGVQTLRFADAATPDRGRKPAGAIQLQLFIATGDAAATDPRAAGFRAAVTRNPVEVPFTSADDGKIATYFARWATRTGEVGPWSLPVSMRIAA
jgi:hypothetical protein